MPDVSIVIPVYNEEGILREAITELLDGYDTVRVALDAPELTFEVIIAENGSRDRTVELAEHLAAERPEVRTFSLGEPNYGKALRRGILEAQGTWVICEEIDLCDRRLPPPRARASCATATPTWSSARKAMKGASDHRPLFRRAATRVLNGMLRVALDFRGTDTHGLKAFHRATLLPIVERCVIDRDLFASELVIRAGRDGRAPDRDPDPARTRSGRPRSTSSSACRTSCAAWRS